MTTLINLNRASYLDTSPNGKSIDYLSAKYSNIRFILSARTTYTVTSADAANLPGLSFKFYGDKNYWWVLGLYNGILDPIGGLTPGTSIQIPSITDINAYLSRDVSGFKTLII